MLIPKIITAGSNYLDIDAYACMVSMAELLRHKGEKSIAYSKAPCNYSVCKSLTEEGQISKELSLDFKDAKYIIVDVSDPGFLEGFLPLDAVLKVYDHHTGFEEYWKTRIGKGAHIEFIGAAATLICREWKRAGLLDKMSHSTAKLIVAAILDNTLNLTSSNTTQEDIDTFNELCEKFSITKEWCELYFSEVQDAILADLKNAILNDIKTVRDNSVLPKTVAQLCIWDGQSILSRLSEIRAIFADITDSFMINIIDIKNSHSYFLCDDVHCQVKIEKIFDIHFVSGVAKTKTPYLRKQIIKNTLNSTQNLI